MAEYDMNEIMEAYRREWEKKRTRMEKYTPIVYKCSFCKDTGFVELYPQDVLKPAGGRISTMMYCPHCRANKLKDISGIIAEYKELDIAKFPWDTYEKDTTRLKRITESFVYDFHEWQNEGIGLYIYSDAKGSGKTMVANAICGSICTKYNLAVRFAKIEDILADVKKSYDSRNREEPAKANVQKYFDAELLVIDDLGVSKINEWGQGVLHDLINERYKADKLCIITSNFIPENLPVYPATVDRINDMCLVLHFPEEPIRAQNALKRKNKILQYVDSYDKFTDASDISPFNTGGNI